MSVVSIHYLFSVERYDGEISSRFDELKSTANTAHTSGRLRGRTPGRPLRPKIFSISFSFSQNWAKTYMLAPPSEGWRPHTGNPGSAPVIQSTHKCIYLIYYLPLPRQTPPREDSPRQTPPLDIHPLGQTPLEQTPPDRYPVG